MKKTIITDIVILLILPIIGLILMIAVHLLPTDRIRQNINSSRDSIVSDFTNEMVINGYIATLSGNFTDCLMLEFAAYDSPHSVIDQVLNMYRTESGPDEWTWWPGQSLLDCLDNVPQNLEVEYSRYWHGYLVILKPLLMYTSFDTVRLLNSAMQLILFAAALILCTKKGNSLLALSLAVSMPFMYFVSSFASLSLSICIYLLFVGLIIQLLFEDTLSDKNRYLAFFIIMGASAAYFDFLTYPLVTYAFPMCVYLFIHNEKISEQFKKIICFGISWVIGYGFMWASKWLLAVTLSGSGTIRNALSTVKKRTGISSGNMLSGYFNVVKNNLSYFKNRALLPVVLICFAAILVLAIKCGISKYFKNLIKSLPLFAVSLTPFAWWFLTSNHSGEHHYFTCRIFSVTVFALSLAFAKAYESKKDTSAAS